MANWSAQQRLAALAGEQHGVFARRQALEVGATDRMLHRMLESGRLVRRADGLYQVASAVPGWPLELRAALLVHRNSVVSHRAAAALHRWHGYTEGPVDVIAPGAPNYRSLGTVHRTSDLVESDCTTRRGFPVTTELRTVIDLAAGMRKRQLEWLVDDLLAAKVFSVAQLTDRFTALARKGKPGTAALRAVFGARGAGYVPPASRLERKLCDVLAAAGLPNPVRQHPLPSRVGPGRVDLAYPWARLLIEADSRRWHTRVADFENDRRRDNEATALGWSILRITWKQLVENPSEVVQLVRECLRRAA